MKKIVRAIGILAILGMMWGTKGEAADLYVPSYPFNQAYYFRDNSIDDIIKDGYRVHTSDILFSFSS